LHHSALLCLVCNSSMRWYCKCCSFSSPKQRTLITHYKLKHCNQKAIVNPTKMLLRLIVSPQDIRKLRLDSVPKSAEDLKLVLKNKLQLSQSFDLHYKDEDFQDFCNLTCVDDLPKDKATLKIIFCPDSSEPCVDSCSSSLTFSASSPTSTSSSQSASFTGRSQPWPIVFPVPTFSFDAELRLRQGNDAFETHGKLLALSRDIKSEILDKMAETMFSFKAYPANEDFESAAIDLVEKHPCLKEPGSTSGWYGWKISLKFKMGNYRQKLRDAGCQELKINSEKRGPGNIRGRRNEVKKPRRSETNFLPDLPQGRDIKNLEEDRVIISQEMKTANPNLAFIDSGMSPTFALRRKEIVEEEPPVVERNCSGPRAVGGLDRSPVQHRHTQDKQPCTHSFTPKGNLEKPINLTVVFLDCGRKLEFPERTHTCTGRTCKLHAERP
ncbi:hypothetical protein AMECASPLE_013014, partial [Ameca splendens]